MRVHLTSFWFQKPSLKREEFEDAFYPKAFGGRARVELRFAIADGATEGVGSAAWARILVEAYCRSRRPRLDVPDFLLRAYRQWSSHKEHYLRQQQSSSGGVPWFVEEGLRVGAFSTLLGLRLYETGGGSEGEWEATAVGDSCLAHMRQDELLRMWNENEFRRLPGLE